MGQLTMLFVLFAIPAGFIGRYVGRRSSICCGIVMMAICSLAQYLLPASTLTRQLGRLPLLGIVPVIGITMMLTGVGWSFIHTNSLPMLLDMTSSARAGTYIGLYYLFSTLSAIAGPYSNGWIIHFTGNNYNSIMIVAPIFMAVALGMMWGVKRGEAAA